MYQKILVPLDQSAFSEFALPTALRLARRWGAELRLVTVAVPAASPPFATQGMDMGPALGGDLPHPESPYPIADVADRAAEEYLETTAERLQSLAEASGDGGSISLSWAVEQGVPAEALQRHVEDAEADLVIMTTHARGPLTRVWLGSVADDLARRTSVPVLLIRPDPEEEPDFDQGGDYRHVVVPLEEWEGSRAVLADVRHFAEASGARVTLLHVEALPDPLGSPYIPHAADEQRKWTRREREMEARLEEVASGLRADGLDVSSRVTVARDPADGILDFAEAYDADLIAMSTRGRRGFDRLVRGSVSDEVTRSIDVAVLLHRVPEKE